MTESSQHGSRVGKPAQPVCAPWCTTDHGTEEWRRELAEAGGHYCEHDVLKTPEVLVAVYAETLGLLPGQTVEKRAPRVTINFASDLYADAMPPEEAMAIGAALLSAGEIAIKGEGATR